MYEVPDALLARARRVRCVRCGTAWVVEAAAVAMPEPVAPAPAPVVVVAPPPEPPAPRPAVRAMVPPPPPAPSGGPLLAAAWIGSLLLLAGGATAAWTFREEVMAAWPPAARLFAALGG